MSLVIDFHVHIVPDKISPILPEIGRGKLIALRNAARNWLRPVTATQHKIQTLLRVIPLPARKKLDPWAGLTLMPGLLFEATPEDLKNAMKDAGIHYSLLIAHPPLVSNDLVLETCEGNPKLIPAVNIPSGTAKPGDELKNLVKTRGARVLKIHPAADGEGVDSPRYLALLESADELKIPVVIHTGCVHSSMMFKAPEQGEAQRFAPWFRDFPKLKFTLAHMNLHEPNIALDLAEKHENVFVDTSWQPSEAIGEAVRRIGAERVLFATDWPFIGNNQRVGLHRIQECIDMRLFGEKEAALIRGKNAAALLGLDLHAI